MQHSQQLSNGDQFYENQYDDYEQLQGDDQDPSGEDNSVSPDITNQNMLSNVDFGNGSVEQIYNAGDAAKIGVGIVRSDGDLVVMPEDLKV